MSDDTQDQPVMSGSDEATEREKTAGRDEQERADAAFYDKEDTGDADESTAEPARSAYSNPSSGDFTHQRDGE
ncbi:hypothetical protein N1028_18020 [Herbiconiux sp. CPCC 203407]|uniref:Uncharacterized protein n=1 Tax=Herbiconiux oxytropis TaxID=2970915 RepID=A0AA41XKS3_9MICO|nr:hypothetical protein [Herbiconiux oxytropis]MCS5722866.1 hypothetical protein [Herbiconiux oxytropis]MCS5727796.1 hypothetical protein [Herbiconiux oxytropis]